MIEYENYGKLESLAELENAIEMGLDIEFLLYDTRYNISWRDNKPFICECPEGVAKFFDTSELLLQRYEVGDNPLKSVIVDPSAAALIGMKWVTIL